MATKKQPHSRTCTYGSIIPFYLSGRFLTRHTQKNNNSYEEKKRRGPFFLWLFFFFRATTQAKQNTLPKTVFSVQCSVVSLLKKNLMMKKKKIRERKKKMPKRMSKTEDWGRARP